MMTVVGFRLAQVTLEQAMFHHENKSYTPLLYSKIGVYRGIHFFLIFAPKHRLWVLVRTSSLQGWENAGI